MSEQAAWALPADIASKGRAWKQRNALVEANLRLYLASVPRGVALSTLELSGALTTHSDTARAIGSILTKLAPWMGPLATHDGDTFISFGRVNKRWRWHGQRAPLP